MLSEKYMQENKGKKSSDGLMEALRRFDIEPSGDRVADTLAYKKVMSKENPIYKQRW